jgi:serine/threonine protein kinase
MPSPTTADELLDLLRKSEVVDEKRLEAHVATLRAKGAVPPEPGTFAGVLVRDGLITHFQAEQLLQGKWRRFTIGKYKVLERLGSGGMGSVYLCEHKLMKRRVAVKVLPAAKAEDPSSLERFYREARAVAALDHPNIVRAYDIDQDDKLHFLVMEHVNGASLQEIIKKIGPMEVIRAAHYMRQAALGLEHAHAAAGLVHRDIKPGNILVDRSGIVKVLDMGLARFFHDEEDALTVKFDENVLGTADYLAPEQAQDSHGVDIRADIYSLGCTFYFCLAGKPPFAEGSVAQKLIWHQTRQPKPIQSIRPDVPEGIVAVLNRMLAKDPRQRYQRPADVAEALAPWTQTPIPPPPEHEMPRLSLAALATGPVTEPLQKGMLSPTPRPNWQVSDASGTYSSPPQRGPATPLRTPVARSQAPSPSNTPTSGPRPAAPTPPAVRTRPPEQTKPPPPLPPNKRSTSTTQAIRPSPVAPTEDTDRTFVESTPADGLALDPEGATDQLRFDLDTGNNRVATTRLRTRSRNAGPPLLLIGVLVGGIALLLGGAVISVLAWSYFRSGTSSTAASPAEKKRVTLWVSRSRSDDHTFSTLGGALLEVKRRQLSDGVRILVETDLHESILLHDWPRISIEAAQGKEITWTPFSQDESANGLLILGNVPEWKIKGFTLDGQGKTTDLITLWGRCPGLVLEDLKLKGFTRSGVLLGSCAGGSGENQEILLDNLDLTTSAPQQRAIYFTLFPHIPAVPQNEHVIIRDCTFVGRGAKVATADLNHINAVNSQEIPKVIQDIPPPKKPIP